MKPGNMTSLLTIVLTFCFHSNTLPGPNKSSTMSETLAIIKPDAFDKCEEIVEIITKSGLNVIQASVLYIYIVI